MDIQEKTTDEGFQSKRNQAHRSADLSRRGKRVMILAGQGALGAGDELEQVAEILGAPIAKALLGKAVVPDTARTLLAASDCSVRNRLKSGSQARLRERYSD